MSDLPTTAVPAKKKRTRSAEVIGVIVVIGLVVLAALFQESIAAFFSLKLWDKAAASRSVEQFLSAGKKGDKQATQALLGSKDFQELNTDGKWRGYFIVSQAGKMEFDFAELAPQGEPKASAPEFITIGKGAAEVTAPDSTGKAVKYRLEMVDGSWKITEILGGHPPAPAPSGSKPSAKAPGSRR